MTQKEWVLKYLQSGNPITPMKALAEKRIFRLAAVVNVLRDEGYNIETRMRKSFEGRPYAEYRLVQPQKHTPIFGLNRR
jgi:hypothetical protein